MLLLLQFLWLPCPPALAQCVVPAQCVATIKQILPPTPAALALVQAPLFLLQRVTILEDVRRDRKLFYFFKGSTLPHLPPFVVVSSFHYFLWWLSPFLNYCMFSLLSLFTYTFKNEQTIKCNSHNNLTFHPSSGYHSTSLSYCSCLPCIFLGFLADKIPCFVHFECWFNDVVMTPDHSFVEDDQQRKGRHKLVVPFLIFFVHFSYHLSQRTGIILY